MDEMRGLMLIVIVFGIILLILWICLPFAVFGTKPKLDELISQMKETNALLYAIGEKLDARDPAPRAAERTQWE